MAEEHHTPRKYGIEKDDLKITAAVWPYFEDDGSIRWKGTAVYGGVVILEVSKGLSDVSARQLLVAKLNEASSNVKALSDAVLGDIRRG